MRKVEPVWQIMVFIREMGPLLGEDFTLIIFKKSKKSFLDEVEL